MLGGREEIAESEVREAEHAMPARVTEAALLRGFPRGARLIEHQRAIHQIDGFATCAGADRRFRRSRVVTDRLLLEPRDVAVMRELGGMARQLVLGLAALLDHVRGTRVQQLAAFYRNARIRALAELVVREADAL